MFVQLESRASKRGVIWNDVFRRRRSKDVRITMGRNWIELREVCRKRECVDRLSEWYHIWNSFISEGFVHAIQILTGAENETDFVSKATI